MTRIRRSHLRDYQRRVLVALARGLVLAPGATFTVMFPRQAGKNEVSAALVAWLLQSHARRGGTVIICAPTLYPQASISLERTAARLESTGHGTRRENTLQVGRARAIFLSASPQAHVAGHTASIALIADEAQDIDRDWFNRQFRPMAASTGAATVLFGTPWNGESLLEEAVRRNRAHRFRRSVALHHEVDWPTVAAAVPEYGQYVRQERDRLGAGHPLFVTQYELRTVSAAGRLLTSEQIARVVGSHPSLPEPRVGERYVAGLDFGGDGRDADSTVLVIGRAVGDRLEIVHIHASQGVAYSKVIGELAAILSRWKPVMLCADGTGLGSPLVDALQRRLSTPVERVVFTGAVKSELGYALIAAASTGRLSVYADDRSATYRECLEQLRDCSAHTAGGALLRWGNDRGHDDYVVALALCLRALGAAGPRRIAAGRAR